MSRDLNAHIYESYSRAAAAHLLGLERARGACGDQLFIGRSRTTWLASPPEGSFFTPTRFRWAAARRYEEADDEYWFLPLEVRERGVTAQGIDLFFAPDASSEFIYVGGGSFASYGFSSTASLGEVDVHLHRKLPEDVWLRVGGYKGWSLTIGGRERRGLSEDEVLDLVGAAIEAGGGDLWLTRYQEDSLSMLVEPRRAFVMYMAFPGDSGMTARDKEMKGSDETAAFTLANGEVDEFPYEETLSKNDALAVVEHFLNAGELAPSVRWVES